MKDYIDISGKRYRVEVTMEALALYLDAKGGASLDAISDKMTIQDWYILLCACIWCGEKADGNECSLKFDDLTALRINEGNKVLKDFMEIYRKQSGAEGAEESKKKE